MIVKAIEIRDRGTFIPALSIKMVPVSDWEANVSERMSDSERYLLRRAGYGFEEPCVVLCRMECSGVDRNATYDPYSWGGGARTMPVAHDYIIKHFDELESGTVVDVEFILGETKESKKSEREE